MVQKDIRWRLLVHKPIQLRKISTHVDESAVDPLEPPAAAQRPVVHGTRGNVADTGLQLLRRCCFGRVAVH